MLRPKHILMTSDAVGGIWTYCMELCRGFAAQGISVTLANLGPHATDAQIEELLSIPRTRLLQRALLLEWMDEPYNDVQTSGRWLQELVQDLKPDFLHLNGYCHGGLEWQIPNIVVGHSCVASWWAHVKREPLPQKYSWYRAAVARGLRGCNLVVTPTAAMLHDLEEQYGSGFSSVVVPNGRTTTEFHSSPKEPFVFSCGRVWDEAKNISILERSADRLTWPVYVAGSTRHPSGKHFSSEHLRTLGALTATDVKGWYSRAGIYAAPARYEPFGLSVLEAALSGCALVLSNIASFRELWNGAALFVDPDDEKAWIEAVNDLAESQSMRTELGEAARRRAGSYSSDRMVEGYLAAYELVVANQRRTACAS